MIFSTSTSKRLSFITVCASLAVVIFLSGCGLFGGEDPPSAPGSLQLSASQSGVEVTWEASSNADGYNIYRSESAIPEDQDLSSVTKVNGGSLVQGASYTDGGAENSKEYFYRITAENGAGESGPSPQGSVQMPFPESPDRPDE